MGGWGYPFRPFSAKTSSALLFTLRYGVLTFRDGRRSDQRVAGCIELVPIRDPAVEIKRGLAVARSLGRERPVIPHHRIVRVRLGEVLVRLSVIFLLQLDVP